MRDCSPLFVYILYFDYFHVAFVINMGTDADRLAADKAAADKRVADEAAASAAAKANWPIGGYNTLIPLVLISICAVLLICVDVSTICLVRAYITKIQYVISNFYAMFMIYY